ncbi:hypothetical protein VTL71DRAFT_7147 [Oculimacula yallundae]|uniref:Homeobox domain-containing protein n=1 Tax=Oculimacula yallundae TaxID=86028 RepID=A0ABR4BVV9_9HELO
MFVAINANPPATVPRQSSSRSPLPAMDSDTTSPPPMDNPRIRPPSWTDAHKERFQEIITAIGSTVGTSGAPSSYAQLFDLASKKLGELGIIKSSTQCKDKWYRMANRAENETLFNFTRGRSRHGTFGDDKLEVEEPAEEALESSFAQDEDSLIVANGDEGMVDAAEGSGHRSTVRWDDRERDALIELVRTRRDLELKDSTQPVFNAGQVFNWASTELQHRYNIERTVSSCMIFWRRNIAGTRGFGTGNEATHLVPGSSSASKSTKPVEDTPSMTLRETPTKSKRLQNSLQEPRSPKQPKQPKQPKAEARASSPKLGRKFTTAQKEALAKEAENGLNPSPEVRARLVQELNLSGQQVSGYFGNARFKARKLNQTGPPKVESDLGEAADAEETSILSEAAPDSGVKTRKYSKRKRSTSMDSDDEPLLTPSVKPAPANVDSDASMGTEEKVYGSRPGMLKRKAPARDSSLPFLPPPSYEDSMLKASPNPYGSPRNPPHLSRSPLPTEPARSSSSRLSLEPTTMTGSSLRDTNTSLPGSHTPNTAPTSSTSAATTASNLLNLPHTADDQQMESILASKVNRIDEEMSVLLKRIDDHSIGIQDDEQIINDLDRQIQDFQARRAAVLAARQEKEASRAGYSNRCQVLGNRKSQIAKALRDLKAAFEDDAA